MFKDLIRHVAGETGLTQATTKSAIGVILNVADRQGSPFAEALFTRLPGARTLAAQTGADVGAAFFQDTLTEEPIILDDVDTVVLALGHQAESALEQELTGLDVDVLAIGDCVVPRTAEEAVFEGMQAGRAV